MLGELIRSGSAFLDRERGVFTVSHQKVQLRELASLLPPVRCLKLNHCGLATLEGIELFPYLEELSLRHNSLEQPAELLRIRNKDILTCLDFTGNDIEYLGSCLFLNLVKHFPQLIELNGRNYHDVIHQKQPHSLKRLLAKAHRIQKDMQRTVKDEARSIRERTVTVTSVKTQPQMQTKNYEHYYQEEVERQEEEEEDSSYSGEPCTAKKTRSREEQGMTGSRRHLEDISLGAISNIPLTKSVRGSCVGDKNKGRGLEIFTLNQSLQGNRVQLTQPTATFAMQRQKENMDPTGQFGFRNKEKTQKYRIMGTPIEEFGGESWKDEERPTKRETYGSVQEEAEEEVSWDSSFNHSLTKESRILIKKSLKACSVGLHNNFLLHSHFKLWKNLRNQRNLPLRRLQ